MLRGVGTNRSRFWPSGTVSECFSAFCEVKQLNYFSNRYDKMRGASTKELYERVLDELDDELELVNKVGFDDDDLQRDRV